MISGTGFAIAKRMESLFMEATISWETMPGADTPTKMSEQFFKTRPEPLTREEKRAWLDQLTGVSLGSDAFFPFGDNIERAHRSGVQYVAEPGGSIRDDNVIAVCDSYDMVMCFTHMRLFHH